MTGKDKLMRDTIKGINTNIIGGEYVDDASSPVAFAGPNSNPDDYRLNSASRKKSNPFGTTDMTFKSKSEVPSAYEDNAR